MLTFTLSNFFHQSFGSPVPLTLDGAPFAKLPAPLVPSATGAALNRAVFQGSSAEYCGAGARGGGTLSCGGGSRNGADGEGGVNTDMEGWKEDKSRFGSGSVFCDAKAATCSILMSMNGCLEFMDQIKE